MRRIERKNRRGNGHTLEIMRSDRCDKVAFGKSEVFIEIDARICASLVFRQSRDVDEDAIVG